MKSVHHPSEPILEYIRHVPNRVTMRKQIPSPSTVAVVVEPRAEDEVRGDAKEEAGLVSDMNTNGEEGEMYMTMNQVKNPQ